MRNRDRPEEIVSLAGGKRKVNLDQTSPQTPSLDDVRAALGSRRPKAFPDCRAAVAVICCEQAGALHLLFITRAQRAGDPWSGHLAFPGGRLDPDDADPRAAAERETREEIGLDLGPEEYLGRLDDLATVTTSMLVAAFVYGIALPRPLRIGDEGGGSVLVSVRRAARPGAAGAAGVRAPRRAGFLAEHRPAAAWQSLPVGGDLPLRRPPG